MNGPPGLRTSDYEFELPPERIARFPVEPRDASRLLVLRRATGQLEHRRFADLVRLVPPGDLLVLNETRVIPARLLGTRPSGAPAEVLLLHPTGDATGEWLAMVRPGAKLGVGRRVRVAAELEVEIVAVEAGGERRVRLHTQLGVQQAIEQFGTVPLPPYLERSATPEDRERYQTVFAREPGSVAAPTAGLHFTPDLLARLDAAGVRRATVTLHVGPGTFRPVEGDDPAAHPMHAEWFRVPPETTQLLQEVRAEGGRVWAVGTTTVRTLESAATEEGGVAPGEGWTRLFVRPGYRFRVVDHLLTNFHLPRSTLLMLVAALGGYEVVMGAYREAVARGYRFYSYGDAMAVI